MNILIVDDEKKLADAIGQLFKQNKYLVDVAYDGEEGLFYAQKGNYDIIILDVMMPKMDGYQVVESLRKLKSNVPIIMLTAKDDLASRVKGLDMGADDYLAKPFEGEELLARVRALTRRQSEMVFDEIKFHDIVLNTANYTLNCNEKSIGLGAKEYEILKLMLTNPHQVINKDTIISKVWGLDSDITDNNIEAYMSFLRKKLFFVGSTLYIATKRMLGYYLEIQG